MFEYSETVICGDGEGIRQPRENGPKQVDDETLDKRERSNKPVKMERFGMHDELGEEVVFYDTDLDNSKNKSPTPSPPKRRNPSLGIMCGAVPLYLMYSVTKANNSQDKEFATKQDQDAIQGRGFYPY